MRVVIDTNVIASGIFFGGRPRQLLEMLLQQDFDAFVSSMIVEEYQETIEELIAEYPHKPVSIPITQIVSACHLIEPVSRIKVCRDPDDDKFIECAYDAKCLYIVSGDKDLRALGHYENIRIVTVTDFLTQFT